MSHHQHYHTATLLLVSSEYVDKDKLVSLLIERDPSYILNIITTSYLPLENDTTWDHIDHVSFIVDLNSQMSATLKSVGFCAHHFVVNVVSHSFQSLKDFLMHVRVDYFLGNASLICVKGDQSQTYMADVNAFINKYNLTPLYVNANDDESYEYLADRILIIVKTSAGHNKGLNSILLGSKFLQIRPKTQ